MATPYKPGNKFSAYMSLADAAVVWQGLSPEQKELVIIDDDGLPFLAGVPDLCDRAAAILEAVHERRIAGYTFTEDGYPRHPSKMQLERESVNVWLLQANARHTAPPPPVSATPAVQDRLLTIQEIIKIVGSSRSTLYRAMDRGDFPKPTHPGPVNKWQLSVINEYVSTKRSVLTAEDAEDI